MKTDFELFCEAEERGAKAFAAYDAVKAMKRGTLAGAAAPRQFDAASGTIDRHPFLAQKDARAQNYQDQSAPAPLPPAAQHLKAQLVAAEQRIAYLEGYIAALKERPQPAPIPGFPSLLGYPFGNICAVPGIGI
jgi:hypothetical protein